MGHHYVYFLIQDAFGPAIPDDPPQMIPQVQRNPLVMSYIWRLDVICFVVTWENHRKTIGTWWFNGI